MSVIDDYFENVPAPERAALERIRLIVRDMIPESEEVISYGMPGFKLRGKYVLGFAAFKDHLSLFPTAAPIARLRDKLDGYTLATGTIQFTLDKPLPDKLIRELVLDRVGDIRATTNPTTH